MRVYHLVICCVLFTTTVCFNTSDAVPELANGSPSLDSNNQNCNCENGNCVTDKQGNSKCVCKHGFSLQGEFTCKPCDCGSLGKCIFILTPDSNDQFHYEKKCVCDVGKAEENGVCVDCFCGEHSSCDFDHGEKRCYCIEGYSEKDGVCTKCDCGFNGECEYEDGNKKCECDEGYLELNGICEACDCGSNSESCVFVDGVKQCKCKDRYADRYGTCEECYCGDHTQSCKFKENQKTCSCLEGYVQKGEMCELGCSAKNPCQNGGYCEDGFCFCLNGTRGEFCDVIDVCSNLCPNRSDVECAYDTTSQKAYCRCLDNNHSYDHKIKQCRRTCQEDKSCKNKGKCTGTSQLKFCDCLEGTTGDFCEEIPVCRGVKCGSEAYCVFDPSTKKAGCACKNSSQNYDSTIGKCRRSCSKDNECLNGGKCGSKGTKKFCNCLPGTEGERCEVVTKCAAGNVRCSKTADCIFDVSTKKAICKCKNNDEVYDYLLGTCRYHCKNSADCRNGGKCVLGWCLCQSGTHGARCEIVDDCHYGRITCNGVNAICVYDVRKYAGTCECKNRNEYYSFWFRRCMRKLCFIFCRRGEKKRCV